MRAVEVILGVVRPCVNRRSSATDLLHEVRRLGQLQGGPVQVEPTMHMHHEKRQQGGKVIKQINKQNTNIRGLFIFALHTIS